MIYKNSWSKEVEKHHYTPMLNKCFDSINEYQLNKGYLSSSKGLHWLIIHFGKSMPNAQIQALVTMDVAFRHQYNRYLAN